jgi:hypothetical protein
MRFYGDGMLRLQSPLDWPLEGTSSWINMLSRDDPLQTDE